MPNGNLNSPGNGAGGGPGDGTPAAGAGAEAQAVEGGGVAVAPEGTPAAPAGEAQGGHDWEKRYVDTQKAYAAGNIALKEAKAALAERDARDERLKAMYGEEILDPEATEPSAPTPDYWATAPEGPPGMPGAAVQEPPHITAMRDRINELYAMGDHLQANQLAVHYGFIQPVTTTRQAAVPPPLTEEQEQARFDERYDARRNREDTQARNFEASLDQIRADVPGGFVASVEAKLVAYAEEHNEHNAWNCLHATCEAEYRAAVKKQMLDAAWAEIRSTNPNALPPRPAALGGPDAQAAQPNPLTKELEDLGYSTKPPQEHAQ